MRVVELVTIVLLIVSLSACNRPEHKLLITSVPTETTVRIGTFDETLVSDGITRHYRLHIPSTYQSGIPTALVINLHGLRSNASEQEALSSMSIKADKEGFIVAYPTGRNEKWSVGPGVDGEVDREFIRNLIHHLQNRYTIDVKRIYATGISNGGGMANRLACDMADVIAAIAPVSGAYNFWRECNPSRPIAVLAFHGTADKIVPYKGVGRGNVEPSIQEWANAWAERNDCDLTPSVTAQTHEVIGKTWSNCKDNAIVVLYTIEKHGHSWPGSDLLPNITSKAINATDVMWEFFLSHPLP